MDSSEHGIIYVSWGSMIRAETLPEKKREELLKAFSSFKQTFLWKFENETLPNQPANVHILKWMPQREILCHPKVKVFLTHGGLLGSSEAAYCGVPVVSSFLISTEIGDVNDVFPLILFYQVSTPMYGDQVILRDH